MKPPPFAYADPAGLPEALATLAEHGDDGKVLAGGQSLVPLLNLRLAQPAVLIDINRLPDLNYVRRETRNGTPGLAIGTLTRYAAAEESAEVAGLPLLREGLRYVGHPAIRNRGTVGGSVAHADPAAELPLVFRAVDGVARVESSRRRREIPAADFFLYTFTTALESDELLTEVWLPLPGRRTGQAFVEVARRHGDYALVAAAASLTLDEHGICTEARIAIGGAAPVPIRVPAAEDAVRGERASLRLFSRAGALAAAAAEPTGDVHADAEYRREVVGTLTARALTRAFERVPED